MLLTSLLTATFAHLYCICLIRCSSVEERLVNVDAPKTARVSLMNMEKTLVMFCWWPFQWLVTRALTFCTSCYQKVFWQKHPIASMSSRKFMQKTASMFSEHNFFIFVFFILLIFFFSILFLLFLFPYVFIIIIIINFQSLMDELCAAKDYEWNILLVKYFRSNQLKKFLVDDFYFLPPSTCLYLLSSLFVG